MQPETPEGAALEQPPSATVEDQGGDSSRGYHVLDDPVIYVVIAFGVILTTALPVFLGQRFCLPLLNTLVIFPLFVWAVRVGRPRRAVALGAFWAVCQALAMLAASLALPQQAGNAVLNGMEMRSQAIAWTVADAFGRPAGFIVGLPFSVSNQLIQLVVVAAGSLLTAGLIGLLIDALTLNATSYIAASVVQLAGNPLLALAAAWPLWTVLRLAGYLLIGAVLAEPLAVGAVSARPDEDAEPAWTWARWWRRSRRLLGVGLGLAALSIVLQALLGPSWATLIRQITN
jgi:hypothetical protein